MIGRFPFGKLASANLSIICVKSLWSQANDRHDLSILLSQNSRSLGACIHIVSVYETTMSIPSDFDVQALDEMGQGCPSRVHRPPIPPPPFRFFDMPGEIQNMIVREFIVSEHPIIIHEPRFNRHPSPPPRPRSRPRYDRPVPLTPSLPRSTSNQGRNVYGHTRLALMLTCRKLYREHWRTYYGGNVFEFNFDLFTRFSKEMPARCLSQIRRIKLWMPHRQYHDSLWFGLSNIHQLEGLELCLRKPVMTDETIVDCCMRGISSCANLKVVRLRRYDPGDDERSDEELLSRDREFQEKVDAILQSKACRRQRLEVSMHAQEQQGDLLAQKMIDSIDEVSS